MHFLGFQGGGCASGGDAGGFGAAVGIKLRLIAAVQRPPATSGALASSGYQASCARPIIRVNSCNSWEIKKAQKPCVSLP